MTVQFVLSDAPIINTA